MTERENSWRFGLIVFSYCTVAYGWSWSFWFFSALDYTEGSFFPIVLNTVGVFGPTIAAIVVTAWKSQLVGVRSLLAQGLRWRFDWQWYGVVLGLPPVIFGLALLLHISMGATASRFLWIDNWLWEPLTFIFILLAGVPLALGEELGWRGFLLPVLQSRLNALWASVCVGVIWTFWHLPLFFIPDQIQHQLPFPLYILHVVALAIIFTWVYNSTQGSVLSATILHTLIDAWGVLTVLPQNLGSLRPFAISNLLLWLMTILIIWRAGATHLIGWYNQNAVGNDLDMESDVNS